MEHTEKTAKNQEDIARGHRLKELRTLAGLTVIDLAKLLNISRATLSYWQSGGATGLSPSGAHAIINVLRDRKIQCSYEWLWNGIGKSPSLITSNPDASTNLVHSIQDEINFFANANKESVVVKIDTGELYPFFEFKDIVAGTWQPTNTFHASGFCIIQLEGVDQVRWIKKIEGKQQQVEFSYSPLSKNVQQIELDRVARVIRVWR